MKSILDFEETVRIDMVRIGTLARTRHPGAMSPRGNVAIAGSTDKRAMGAELAKMLATFGSGRSSGDPQAVRELRGGRRDESHRSTSHLRC
jgi:hypothetical protein